MAVWAAYDASGGVYFMRRDDDRQHYFVHLIVADSAGQVY